MIMKRLIVISVIFALVAGAAFAEINVGGGVFGKVDVLQGTSQKELKIDKAGNGFKETDALTTNGIFSGGEMKRVRLDGSGQNDEGTFGGYIRLEQGSFDGNAWWKPIDQFKLLIGGNGGDGFFNKDGVARWGFYQGAGDIGVASEGWAFGSSFYGGFAGPTKGAILTITPLEALEINIGIPFFLKKRAEEVFKRTEAQVAYSIDGIGQFAVTYQGGYAGDKGVNDRNTKVSSNGSNLENTKGPLVPYPDATGFTNIPDNYNPNDPNSIDWKKREYSIASVGAAGPSKFFAYFDLSAIENLGIQLGIGFTLPAKDELEGLNAPAKFDPTDGTVAADPTAGKWTQTQKYNAPLAVGLGVSFDAGAFGIKARVQGEFAEKFTFERTDQRFENGALVTKSQERTLKGPLVVTGDILPSFAINDSMKIFLSAGLKLTGKYNVIGFVENSAYKAAVDAGTPTTGLSELLEKEIEQDSKVGWHINPYFTKSAGPGTFYAGFRLSSDGEKWIESYARKANGTFDYDKPNKKTIINWSVPIGVTFGF